MNNNNNKVLLTSNLGQNVVLGQEFWVGLAALLNNLVLKVMLGLVLVVLYLRACVKELCK